MLCRQRALHTHTYRVCIQCKHNKATKAATNTHRREGGRERGRERANFKGSVLETAKNCRNSTNDVAAASKQSLKVAKVYPVAPPGDMHNKNAHLNVNDFNGRTRKNLEPVLFITLTLMLSKDGRRGEGRGRRARCKCSQSHSRGKNPTGLAAAVARCTLPCLFLLRL